VNDIGIRLGGGGGGEGLNDTDLFLTALRFGVACFGVPFIFVVFFLQYDNFLPLAYLHFGGKHLSFSKPLHSDRTCVTGLGETGLALFIFVVFFLQYDNFLPLAYLHFGGKHLSFSKPLQTLSIIYYYINFQTLKILKLPHLSKSIIIA
jgi:hypothetical protein